MFMLMPPAGFSLPEGRAQQFSRGDLDNAVTRDSAPIAARI